MPTLPGAATNLRSLFDELGRGVPMRVVATSPKPKPDVMQPFMVLNAVSGKHEVYFQFPTGAAVLVATEP